MIKYRKHRGVHERIMASLFLLSVLIRTPDLYGQITNMSINPQTRIVNDTGYQIFQFTTTASIPADGRVAIVYHSGFNLASASSASSSSMDGSFSVSVNGSTVIITRSGGTATSPGVQNIQVSTIRNPTQSGTYNYTIRTQDNGGTQIESGSFGDFIYAGPLHHFTFSGVPSDANAGSPLSSDIVLTARDVYNNQKTNYTGSVIWFTSDPHASAAVPTDDGSGWSAGQKTFSASDFLFYTKGVQHLWVQENGNPSIEDHTGNIDVESGSVSDFTLSCSTPQTAGVSFSLNVSGAVDAWGNSYSGTVNIDVFSGGGNSPDGDPPTIPGAITVTNGSGAASATLTHAVTTQFRGTSGSVVRYSSPIAVQYAGLVDFLLSAGSPVTAGVSFSCSVNNAVDGYGNPWSGSVSVDASSGGSNAPNGTPPSFTNIYVNQGYGASNQILYNAENTVLRGQSGAVTRATSSIQVNPGGIHSFDMSGFPGSVTAGNPFSTGITLTAFDSFGNVKVNYNGSVYFSSTDPQAQFFYDSGNPYTGPYNNGSVTLAGSYFELRSSGTQTISVIDTAPNPDVSETSAGIQENPAEISQFALSCSSTQEAGQEFPVSVTSAQDAFGNSWSGFVTITRPSGSGISPYGAHPSYQPVYVNAGSGEALQRLVLKESGVTLRGTAGTVTEDVTVSVSAGDLQFLKIRDAGGGLGNEIITRSMTVGNSLTFFAAGYDIYGNYRQDEPSNWGSVGSLVPPIASTNVTNMSFVPEAPGNGTISAEAVSNSSISDYTGTITVESGTLDHFAFHLVPKQTKDIADQIRVTAQDASNNVVTSYTGTVDLSDLSTTVQPQQLGPFENGVWIGNITIGQVYTNNRLTVIAPTGETGQSNFFDVVEGPGVRIVEFNTLKADTTTLLTSVTTDQETDWFIKVGIENLGSVHLRLDSVRVEMKINGVIQNDYTIDYPTTFWGNGTNVLAGDQLDSLLVKVDVAGHTHGPMTLEGSIYLRDIDSGNPLPPDDATTGLTVQTPAQLSILEIRPTRTQVTRGQQVPWFVTMVVRNAGESEVLVRSNSASTGISFSIGDSWEIHWPDNMAGGDWFLGGKEIDSLLFSVTRTGDGELGSCQIHAFLAAEELNTSRGMNISADKAIWIEEPPAFRIISVRNASENSPRVNVGRTYPLSIQVENSGGDAILDASLNFQSAGGSILPAQLPLGILSGGEQKDLTIDVVAGSTPTSSEIILVNGVGIAENTQLPLTTVDPMDDSCLVMIQNPAKLEVVSVLPTETDLLGGRVDEWRVKVVVRNPKTDPLRGQADAVLQKPNSTDIRFLIDDQLQEDYTVVAPTGLSNGGLILPGGVTDTLTYRITATGRQGGEVVIQANLSGVDRNRTSQLLTDTGTSVISVTPEEKLRIISTYVEATRKVSEVAYVNTNQSFNIFVKVENGLGQSVKNIRVRLAQSGLSTIADSSFRWIPNLSPSTSATLQFQITASPNAELSGEKFVASIHSAVYQLSGHAVAPGPAIDSTAIAVIQRPALLSLHLSTLSNQDTYSTEQVFSFTATVQNSGDAGIDDTGILQVHPPSQYTLISTDTLHLKSQNSVTWQIRAPSYALSAQAFTVSWYYKPRDINTEQEAMVSAIPTDPLYISTVNSFIYTEISISSPAGAVDDTLSTDQLFTVRAIINWGNTRDIFTTLQLPDGYIAQSKLHQSVNFESPSMQDTVTWLVQAPPAATVLSEIQASTSGVDALQPNIPVPGFPADPIGVVTVPKAALGLSMEITDPEDATDGSLSLGQTFQISVRVDNFGTADTLGLTIVSIDPLPSGYSTSDGIIKKPLKKGEASWNIIAPNYSSASASKIEGKIEQLPLDENTYSPAYVLPNQGSYTIPVTTESYLLAVSQVPLTDDVASSVVPGQKNVKMMTLSFDNRSLRGGNKVDVDALKFDVEDRFGEPVIPSTVISRVTIINEEMTDEVYGTTVDISPDVDMPVSVLFSRLLHISVDGNPTVSVLVDIKDPVGISYFQLNVKNGSYISAKDNASTYPVPVIGEIEENWENMRSPAKYIYNPETESNLWCCPNPFSEEATIYYHLSESGDVTFKIFTLVGDLVWSSTAADMSSGPHTFTWDGTNDKGRQVINGVYWLFMQTEKGIEGKFKIAIVK